jgi:hypothetical protein
MWDRLARCEFDYNVRIRSQYNYLQSSMVLMCAARRCANGGKRRPVHHDADQTLPISPNLRPISPGHRRTGCLAKLLPIEAYSVPRLPWTPAHGNASLIARDWVSPVALQSQSTHRHCGTGSVPEGRKRAAITSPISRACLYGCEPPWSGHALKISSCVR